MRMGKLPLLTRLLVAGALALGATMAVAQGKPDDKQGGAAAGDLPQSRSPDKGLPPLSLLPEADAADELEGGHDAAPGGPTCPDHGTKLELII